MTRRPKLDKIQKKVSFDTDLEVVADLPPDLDPLDAADLPSPVRRSVSECTHGRSRKEVHLRVRSVTFANAGEDEASARRRLCRTPTPYWPRSESPCSVSVTDASFDEMMAEDDESDVTEDDDNVMDNDVITKCQLCQKEAEEAEEEEVAEVDTDPTSSGELLNPTGSDVTKVAPSPRSSPSAKRAFLSKKAVKFNSTVDKEDS